MGPPADSPRDLLGAFWKGTMAVDVNGKDLLKRAFGRILPLSVLAALLAFGLRYMLPRLFGVHLPDWVFGVAIGLVFIQINRRYWK